MPKILVVEDDNILAAQVIEALREQGYLADHAQSGEDARGYFLAAQYDLIILDWNLPDAEGPDICHELRSTRGIQIPVIFLTARSSIEAKEHGFASGADDYLTKPFLMPELLARLRALLRRPPVIQSRQLKVRNIVLDMEKHEVFRGGEKIELFPQEFSLLQFFMSHPNQTFSAEALLRRIWSTDSESSLETVRVTLMRIRQKVDLPGDKPLIITLRKIGYRLEP